MNDLIDTYSKIVEKKSSVTKGEGIQFIYLVLDKFNPTYDNKIIDQAIKMGFLEDMISACVNIVSKNPNLFKVQTYSIYNREYINIKSFIKKL